MSKHTIDETELMQWEHRIEERENKIIALKEYIQDLQRQLQEAKTEIADLKESIKGACGVTL